MNIIEYIEKNSWKTINSLPMYEASRAGYIRNAHTKEVLKQFIAGGYFYVRIKRKFNHSLRVNRLVTEAFHGKPPSSRHQSAHWDGNKQNNRPENLRWATALENANDKARHRTERFAKSRNMPIPPRYSKFRLA